MRLVPSVVEHRQSSRIVLRVPLELRAIEALCEATTAVVNYVPPAMRVILSAVTGARP